MAIKLSPEQSAALPRRISRAAIPVRAKVAWLQLHKQPSLGERQVVVPTKSLAQSMDCSPSTVRRALKDLVGAGFIAVLENSKGFYKEPVYKIAKERKPRIPLPATQREGIEAPIFHTGTTNAAAPRDPLLIIAEKKTEQYVWFLQAKKELSPDIQVMLRNAALAFVSAEFQVSHSFLKSDSDGRHLVETKFIEVMAEYYVQAGGKKLPEYYPPCY